MSSDAVTRSVSVAVTTSGLTATGRSPPNRALAGGAGSSEVANEPEDSPSSCPAVLATLAGGFLTLEPDVAIPLLACLRVRRPRMAASILVAAASVDMVVVAIAGVAPLERARLRAYRPRTAASIFVAAAVVSRDGCGAGEEVASSFVKLSLRARREGSLRRQTSGLCALVS